MRLGKVGLCRQACSCYVNTVRWFPVGGHSTMKMFEMKGPLRERGPNCPSWARSPAHPPGKCSSIREPRESRSFPVCTWLKDFLRYKLGRCTGTFRYWTCVTVMISATKIINVSVFVGPDTTVSISRVLFFLKGSRSQMTYKTKTKAYIWTARFNQIVSISIECISLQETDTLLHTGLNNKNNYFTWMYTQR